MTMRGGTTFLLVCGAGDAAQRLGVAAVTAALRPAIVLTSADGASHATAEVIGAAAGVSPRLDPRLGGGAGLDALRERLAGLAEELAAAHAGAAVVLVAGEGPLYALACEALGAPLPVEGEPRPFALLQGALSVVELSSDGFWTLLRLNEPCPLPADA